MSLVNKVILRKTINLYESGYLDAKPVAEFIELLRGLVDQVPAEYRADVMIKLDDDGDYDGPRSQLSVWYSRDETPEEVVAREAEDAARREGYKQYEIARAKRILQLHGIVTVPPAPKESPVTITDSRDLASTKWTNER